MQFIDGITGGVAVGEEDNVMYSVADDQEGYVLLFVKLFVTGKDNPLYIALSKFPEKINDRPFLLKKGEQEMFIKLDDTILAQRNIGKYELVYDCFAYTTLTVFEYCESITKFQENNR